MSETARIIGLPIDDPSLDEQMELVDKWTEHFRTPTGQWRLHPHQALALEYVSRGLGGLLPLTVGAGKTLLGALLPEAAGIPAKDVVLLCPPGLVAEAEHEMEEYAKHFRVDPPVYLAYSTLSQTDSGDMLDDLAPRMVIADEAHNLKNAKSSRGRRFLRYMVGRRRVDDPVRFVAMSATFSANAIQEFAHLSALALGDGSPVPMHHMPLSLWGRVLDAYNPTPPSEQDYVVMAPLVEAFASDLDEEQSFKSRCQTAFGRRLKATAGVVITDKDSSVSEIVVREWSAALPASIYAAMEELAESATLPNGSIALDLNAKMTQLAHGFYYYDDWAAIGLDGPDLDWLYAKRAYDQAIEDLRKRGAKGYESRALIERAIAAGDPKIPRWLYDVAEEWAHQKHKPEPPRAVEWVSDEPLQQAIEFARRLPNCLVWSGFDAVHDRLEALGLPVARPGERPHQTPHLGVATWSHATGYNLQYNWCNNLVLDPPASAGLWQQLLGRTDRYGQQSDVVQVWVGHTIKEQSKRFKGARKRAEYLERTQQLTQKLIHARFE